MMRNYLKVITPLSILIFFLTSCILPQQVEQSGIITARGTDSANDEIEVSVSILKFDSDKMNSRTVAGRAATLKGGIKEANFQMDVELVEGKIQLDIYGKDIATKGIKPYIDTLGRDANEPDTMYIAMSNTTAKEILTKNEGKQGEINIGQYLHGLIHNSSRSHVFPKLTLTEFLTTFSETGKEPLLPVFDIVEGVPKITAMAIFKRDRYVGDLSIEDKVLYNFIEKETKGEWLEISIPVEPFIKYIRGPKPKQNKMHTASEVVIGNSDTTLIDKENLTFQTEVSMNLNLFEMSEEVSLTDPHVIQLLQSEMEAELKSRYEAMLSKLQEHNSDVFGYGSVYRMHKKDGVLTDAEWDEKFPDIEVNFKVDANIIHHGEHY